MSFTSPFPDVEIRLADPEDVTKDAPDSGPGELLVKGPQVFGGYYKKPEATQEEIDHVVERVESVGAKAHLSRGEEVTVIGAVGGGLLGHHIEKEAKSHTVYKTQVRMDDGSVRTFTEGSSRAVGSKVVVDNGKLK